MASIKVFSTSPVFNPTLSLSLKIPSQKYETRKNIGNEKNIFSNCEKVLNI
jgi:hypothetical protein